MQTLTIIFHVIASILIIITVLLQAGKGAGLGSSFGAGSSSQTVFGSAGPATLLAKITAGGAVVFMLTSLYLTHLSRQERTSSIMSGVPAVTVPSATPAPSSPGLAPQAPTEPGAGK